MLSPLFHDPFRVLRPPTPPPGQIPATTPVEYVPYKMNSERCGIRQGSSALSGQFHLYQKGKCADVKDRIFGLLGISAQSCRENISIDYGLSNIDVALSFIAHA